MSPRGPSQYDGNTDAPMPGREVAINKNLDLGFTVHANASGAIINIPKRPKASTLGREIQVGLNAFGVTQLPSAPVFQYAILFGSGAEKKPVIKKLWASKALQQALPQPHRWIFDGDKIAYSTEDTGEGGEIRLMIDLDAEEGRAQSTGKNTFKVIVKRTTTIRFDQLSAFLGGRTDFSEACLEACNFLDHLLRASAAKRLTSIKRCFYPPENQGQRFPLGAGIEGMKGIYASARLGHSADGNHRVVINADVANGAFWTAAPLAQVAGVLLNVRSEAELAQKFRTPGASFTLRKLRRLRVEAKHRNSSNPDSYVIERFLEQTPAQCKIPARGDQPATTVADYFAKKYNIRLRHPEWPAVKMTKKDSILPLELLNVKGNQRYMSKLDERQTSQMIRMAVTVPADRWKDIQSGLSMLNWGNDPFHKGYGLQINPQQITTKGRLLANPKIGFAGSELDPKTQGRWRVDGKKFLLPNKVPLKSWGVCIINDRNAIDKAAVQRFITEFVKIYVSHGGRVENKTPFIHVPSDRNPANAVAETWKATGDSFRLRPQILVFILPSKDMMTYGRIKKSCECRFGVVSQCMQASHVMKAQAQYISNVCMKFNAKLGGTTSRAIGPQTKAPAGIFKVPTMVVAADVTHPAPKSQLMADEQQCSIAAITTSQDKLAARFSGLVESNGYRVEMIQSDNWDKIWKPQVTSWMQNVGGGRLPSVIFYARDGVSEGQYGAVVTQEVADMKRVIQSIDPKHKCEFVVFVITKRHHIRFFPQGSGDKNGNPLPGTLVETGVTHPFENNFYLCSHVALKGTARPVMVNVLVNEPNYPNEMLQTMLYEHSYQFMRATTPVSLFPAVYYADICAQRGRYHDRSFGSNTPSRSSGDDSSSDRTPPVESLLPFAAGGGIEEAMWYI